MVTFQAKVKISDTIYTLDWDANDKLTIPSEFEAVVTSQELVRILTVFHSMRLWMDSDAKQEIRMTRTA